MALDRAFVGLSLARLPLDKHSSVFPILNSGERYYIY